MYMYMNTTKRLNSIISILDLYKSNKKSPYVAGVRQYEPSH